MEILIYRTLPRPTVMPIGGRIFLTSQYFAQWAFPKGWSFGPQFFMHLFIALFNAFLVTSPMTTVNPMRY